MCNDRQLTIFNSHSKMNKKPPLQRDDDASGAGGARPLRNATQEHSFRSDYNPTLYINRVTRTVDKVNLPILTDEDNHVDWHVFHVPRPLPDTTTAINGVGGVRGPQCKRSKVTFCRNSANYFYFFQGGRQHPFQRKGPPGSRLSERKSMKITTLTSP